MTTPVFAPYIPTYASYTSYITPTEFLNAPTGVDTSQLVPAGTSPQESAALIDLIQRASSKADEICKKVLAATLDVQSGEYRIWNDGTIRVPFDFTPLVSINAVALGYAANAMTAMTDLSVIRPGRKVARIPAQGLSGNLSFSANVPSLARRGWIFADVSYVSGWAHTTIAQVNAGIQQITPVNLLGFAPGLPFTIRDGANSETAQVASTYVPGSASVPLVAPLQNAHAAGTTVSALPPTIKDAVIDLAKWLVKSKGSKAIVMSSIKGQPSRTQKTEPGGDEDYKKAEQSLLRFKRAR